jgi:hypothetical protein
MTVDVTCSDFLHGNERVYARKARRKKIAIVRVEATNRGAVAARLRLGSSTLVAGGTSHAVEDPATIIRKLREFTWDFLAYSIIDFHPVTAALDGVLFVSGPIYNRLLRRRLAKLTNADLVLAPGKSEIALVAFRGVRGAPEVLKTTLRAGDEEIVLQCAVSAT